MFLALIASNISIVFFDVFVLKIMIDLQNRLQGLLLFLYYQCFRLNICFADLSQ